jgi:hypothetical protein
MTMKNNKYVGYLISYNIPKLTRRQKIVGPFLNIVDGDIKPWGYNSTFV